MDLEAFEIEKMQYPLEERIGASELLIMRGKDYLDRINATHAKNLLLCLTKYSDRQWTPKELKESFPLSVYFSGTKLFTPPETSSSTVVPSSSRPVSSLSKSAPSLSKSAPSLSKPTQDRSNLIKEKLTLQEVKLRFYIQGSDGKNRELDLLVEFIGGANLLIEVKKTQVKTSLSVVENFWGKVLIFQQLHPEYPLFSAILSLGGFTAEATEFCQSKGIGLATQVNYIQKKWSIA